MRRFIAGALALFLAFPMPAQAVRFTIRPISGARYTPVVRPLSINIYQPGMLSSPSLTLPSGTALPPSVSQPSLQSETPVSPAVSLEVSPGLIDGMTDGPASKLTPADSSVPAEWTQASLIPDLVADYYDREHWTPEFIADSRYTEILHEGVSMLKSEEDFPLPKVLETMRKKDKNTYSHMMRVGIISGMLALLMGLPQNEARNIAWAARLHDVGKMEDDILALINKKGKLDARERKLIETHPYRGAVLLGRQDDIPSEIQDLAKVVALQHHERMNQVGYPYGVRGYSLALASRITAAADYLDALLENRPYRGGLTLERAHEMMQGVGEQFDPEVQEAIWRLIAPSVLN